MVPQRFLSSYGGFGSKSFVNSAAIAGGAGGRTFIDGIVQDRCLQDGTIVACRYMCRISSANGFKFKVFRPNGSNYDFVSESEKFTPVAGDTVQIRTFTTAPSGVRPGDVFGMWIDIDAGGVGPALDCSAVVASGAIHWIAGDSTGTNVTFPGANDISNFALNIEAFGAAPVAAMTGDSIEAGHGTSYNSFMDGTGPLGDISSEGGYRLQQQIGNSFTYQDYARGSTDWAWIRSTSLPAILSGTGVHASGPLGMSEIWIHTGVNDIFNGRTWASVLADMDAIYAATSCPIFVDEVLPDSNFTDVMAATVRTFNANYATWAAGKSRVRIVPVWPALGQLRASTGLNDDLNALYNSGDGVHINATGAAIVAAIRAGVRYGYYGGSAPVRPQVLQIAPRASYVRGMAVFERIPIRSAATPTTRPVVRYLVVSRRADVRGSSTLWRVPPQRVTRLAPRYLVAARRADVRGSALLGKVSPRHVVPTVRPPSPFVFRGRVDVVRGRALVLAMPVPRVTVTHPVILLPTSAVLSKSVTSVLLQSGITSVLLANNGVTSVILVGEIA
jgi:hypothetical protein